jgi:hypothetical protein
VAERHLEDCFYRLKIEKFAPAPRDGKPVEPYPIETVESFGIVDLGRALENLAQMFPGIRLVISDGR